MLFRSVSQSRYERLAYYTLLFISLGVIALYDLKHTYIPTLFLSLFSFLSFAMLAIRFAYAHNTLVLLGPIVVALPFLLIWLISKGKALGFGEFTSMPRFTDSR